MSGVNRDRFSEIVFPAVEFTLSDGTDVGGTIKYFSAIFFNASHAVYWYRYLMTSALSSGVTESSMYAVKWTIACAVLGIVVIKFREDFRTWFKNENLLVWGAEDSGDEEVVKFVSLALAIAWDIAAFNSSSILECTLPKFVLEIKACYLNRGSKIVLILREVYFWLIKIYILCLQFIYFFNFCFQNHLFLKFIILLSRWLIFFIFLTKNDFFTYAETVGVSYCSILSFVNCSSLLQKLWTAWTVMRISTSSSSFKIDFVSGMIKEFVAYVSLFNLLVALTNGFNVSESPKLPFV